MPLAGPATAYSDLTSAVVQWFKDDPEIDAIAQVREEPDQDEEFIFEGGPYVDVIFEERIADTSIQRIAAGRKVGFYVVYSIWVLAFSPNKRKEAVVKRNRIIDLVEDRLLVDPRFAGLCQNSWQEGGVMADTRRERRWGAAGQVRLMLQVVRQV